MTKMVGWQVVLWASREARSWATLRRRGLAWGSGLGLLEGLLGILLIVAFMPGEGTERRWVWLGSALLMVLVERPKVLSHYAAVALSGALLGWVVAGWAAQVHRPRDP